MRQPKSHQWPGTDGKALHEKGLEGLRWINLDYSTAAIITMSMIAITHAKYLLGEVKLIQSIE